YLEVHSHFDSDRERAQAGYQEQLEAERVFTRACRDAVWKGWPVFRSLCVCSERTLRRAARYATTVLLRQHRPETAGAVRDLLTLLADPSTPNRIGLLGIVGDTVRAHTTVHLPARAEAVVEDEDDLDDLDDLETDGPVWAEWGEEETEEEEEDEERLEL